MLVTLKIRSPYTPYSIYLRGAIYIYILRPRSRRVGNPVGQVYAMSVLGSCWSRSTPNSYQHYLEGQGDLVSGLIMGILRVTIWVIGVIKLLTKSP